MKKLLVTILAFTYLSASSGATINMHYCMGKLMNWDLKQRQYAKCGSCGMKKAGHKGCCKDEQKVFQIDKDQKKSEPAFHSFTISSEAIAVSFAELSSLPISSVKIEKPVAHAPPRTGPVPIFVLNCNFRI